MIKLVLAFLLLVAATSAVPLHDSPCYIEVEEKAGRAIAELLLKAEHKKIKFSEFYQQAAEVKQQALAEVRRCSDPDLDALALNLTLQAGLFVEDKLSREHLTQKTTSSSDESQYKQVESMDSIKGGFTCMQEARQALERQIKVLRERRARGEINARHFTEAAARIRGAASERIQACQQLH